MVNLPFLGFRLVDRLTSLGFVFRPLPLLYLRGGTKENPTLLIGAGSAWRYALLLLQCLNQHVGGEHIPEPGSGFN